MCSSPTGSRPCIPVPCAGMQRPGTGRSSTFTTHVSASSGLLSPRPWRRCNASPRNGRLHTRQRQLLPSHGRVEPTRVLTAPPPASPADLTNPFDLTAQRTPPTSAPTLTLPACSIQPYVDAFWTVASTSADPSPSPPARDRRVSFRPRYRSNLRRRALDALNHRLRFPGEGPPRDLTANPHLERRYAAIPEPATRP